jgi:transketolase
MYYPMREVEVHKACWPKLLPQDQKYIKATLALEMGASQGWHKYVGRSGDVMGIDRYGVSSPAEEIISEYGFTVGHVVARIKAKLDMINVIN